MHVSIPGRVGIATYANVESHAHVCVCVCARVCVCVLRERAQACQAFWLQARWETEGGTERGGWLHIFQAPYKAAQMQSWHTEINETE